MSKHGGTSKIFGSDRPTRAITDLDNATLSPRWDFTKLPLDDQLLRVILLWEQGMNGSKLVTGNDTVIFESSVCSNEAYVCLQSFWDYDEAYNGSLSNAISDKPEEDLLTFVMLVRASLLSDPQLHLESLATVGWGLLQFEPAVVGSLGFITGDFTD